MKVYFEISFEEKFRLCKVFYQVQHYMATSNIVLAIEILSKNLSASEIDDVIMTLQSRKMRKQTRTSPFSIEKNLVCGECNLSGDECICFEDEEPDTDHEGDEIDEEGDEIDEGDEVNDEGDPYEEDDDVIVDKVETVPPPKKRTLTFNIAENDTA